ncbi:hypothetical protein J7426_17625 [Tropicibacter sp. R16_0]|uniref:hypothetical protein n=1 Tax=Tropicibacter sp. R16_0 TaxID=2821102 RepID=UPI001ADA2378|nr:hypothetical protein [Tropicibacter sp. R16_0]MBO9452100.1 hypothetical protein [Tropicibacter sp. R16_0]
MIQDDLSIPDRIGDLIAMEVAEFDVSSAQGAATLDAFERATCPPTQVEVQFSGGVMQTCWAVTRSNGDYRVIYLPLAGYFSLCVESQFGPLDIGVHGSAIGCFSSV